MTAVVHVARHVLGGDGGGRHGRGEENEGLGEEHGCRKRRTCVKEGRESE